MGREIYDIINDMAEVLNASQMQKLQEVFADNEYGLSRYVFNCKAFRRVF